MSLRRLGGLLSPSREHSMGSAALLLAGAMLVSRLVGYLRDAYVAWAFGAGPVTDAYIAAFTLPDFLLYLFAGGSISITFISLYSRFRAQGRDAEAEEVFSIILSFLIVTFTAAVILAEVLAPRFVRWWFPGFTPEQAEYCTLMTRILLPQPIFFLAGGVVSAVQQARRQFLIPAVAPIVYTAFIILGGLWFSRTFGILSLAIGATAGAIAGPFLMNAYGAARTGIGYRFNLNLRHPAFGEWLRLSLPLMIGVSVVAADDWIIRTFASRIAGDITRLNYAKRLLQVPIGVLGQAAGIASLPFFARLWGEHRTEAFAATVNASITRLTAISLLATSWMMTVSYPLVDLAFRRGRFAVSDTAETTAYFNVFALALVFWAIQGMYARAFYATGDMLRPMVSGTLITLLSIPFYGYWFRLSGGMGLALASDVAIAVHTATLMVMLHARGLVRITGLGWGEIARTSLAAVLAAIVAQEISRRVLTMDFSRRSVILTLLLSTLTWLAAALAVLWLTRAELLRRPLPGAGPPASTT